MIKIAQISCGTEWSGVQGELEKAADMIGAKLVFPEVDLESIKKSVEEFGLDVESPNLKLMIARAKSIIDDPSEADAIFMVTCFRCGEGALTKHALRKYLQKKTELPLVMYSFTEKPKLGELLTRMEALATIVERKSLLARERQEGLTLGIDSGSSMTKAVVMENNEVIGASWAPTTDIFKSAEKVKKEALKNAGLPADWNHRMGVTGYGRHLIGSKLNADLIQEELTVASKGAAFMSNKQKGEATVIDVGGLDNKVMTLLNGIPDNFTMGGLCAGASGRFLEIAASRLGIDVAKLGELALKGNHKKVRMDSFCSIFGIQDLVSALARGSLAEDVAAAACNSVAQQVFETQLQEIDLRQPIIEVGGTALVPGLVKAMESILGIKILVPKMPQYGGAVGAALLVSGIV
ncbi:MAG: BadF/BadG/BcrA/BcrD ATPase family protein [Candidatus Bathyarchaeota archaeon BA2]|nr:MAG: BadF/BadG/BcrA/BcrD ATPase family protein [Candidatus Bathyarchaeota archaeon BA2]